VLRISTFEVADGPVALHLDGQVSGKWVGLLQSTCEAHLSKGVQVSLDLKNVSFADRDGIALLRGMRDCGVVIRNASPFVAEQISQKLC